MIKWPNWSGIFDDQGQQRDSHGDIVQQEESRDRTLTQKRATNTPVALTPQNLDLMNLKDALQGPFFEVSKAPHEVDIDSCPETPLYSVGDGYDSPETPLRGTSVAATCGSWAPTPSVDSFDLNSPPTETDYFSGGGSENQAVVDAASNASTNGSAQVGERTPTKPSMGQKVRRSLKDN